MLAQRYQFGDSKTGSQTKQRACRSISVALCGQRHPVTPEHRSRYQQQQWQQIYQSDPAQDRTLGDRYHHFFSDNCCNWIFYLELPGFAAKHLGQFARPATLAIALITATGLAGPDKGILAFRPNNYGTRLQHDYLPL
ncbi:MAG: hypothetical protein WBM09_08860 [Gallionella sp.]